MDETDPATVPILPPPPGLTPNFTDPETNSIALSRLIPVYMTLVVVFAILRLYTRARLTTLSLGVDDALAVLSASGWDLDMI
ncbi:hypothetical protein XA68_16175 [Ophiocordyceps unilateralis]|uniref:Uncharacterized protein n=1 Tax=Ophiocordyceps unilateralis TaxID=268505 RepID=A0A2A9P6W7_OPHUN|nr:hypothetical protein XA68_16175 [Ophiocordyceps unilateralis]